MGDETYRVQNEEALRLFRRVEASGLLWMAIHGNLCLALRHPANLGPSRELVLGFVKNLGRLLVEWGVLTEAQLAAAQKVEQEHGTHWEFCDGK